jgi:hypothetical protein
VVTPPSAPAAPGIGSSALLPEATTDAKGDAKKRSAKLVPQDSRKPPRPRIRPDAKRVDAKRAPKSDAKEPSWNDDSPFMPVQTPKH